MLGSFVFFNYWCLLLLDFCSQNLSSVVVVFVESNFKSPKKQKKKKKKKTIFIHSIEKRIERKKERKRVCF